MLFSPFFCFNCLLFLTCLLLDFSRVSSGHVFVVSLLPKSRQTLVFIYCGFQQQKLQTKISKMGFSGIVGVAYKTGRERVVETASKLCQLQKLLAPQRAEEKRGLRGVRLKGGNKMQKRA